MARRYMTVAVFACALGWLMLFVPQAPLSREVGACEAGAVRDVLAGNVVLPSYDPDAWLRPPPQYRPGMARWGEWGPGGMVQVPPLYWWLAAAGARMFGMSEFALRIPSILAAAAVSAVLYWWAALAFNRRLALWAATLVMLCKYFVDGGLSPRMDMLLVLFVTGGSLCLERAIALGGPGHSSPGRSRMFVGAAVCIALAAMCKGPIGALLPGLAVAGYLILRRRWRDLVAPAMLVTFAAGLSVWVLWCAAAYSVGGRDFFQYQVVEGLLLRFLPNAIGGSSNCRYEPYVYAKVIISQCLPWSLFLPAFVALIAERRGSLPEPLIFATCLFVAVFGFFTLSSGRCLVYVLPCVPPMALMVAYLVTEVSAAPAGLSRTTIALFYCASVVVALAGLVSVIVAGWVTAFGVSASILARLHPTDRGLLMMVGGVGLSLWLWMALSSIGVATAIAGSIRARAGQSAGGVLMVSIAGTFLWFHAIDPTLASRRTLKGFAADVDGVVPPGVVIQYVGAAPPCDLRFYLTHRMAIARRPDGPSPFFMLGEDYFGRLRPDQRAGLELVARSQSTGEKLPRLMLMKKAGVGSAGSKSD